MHFCARDWSDRVVKFYGIRWLRKDPQTSRDSVYGCHVPSIIACVELELCLFMMCWLIATSHAIAKERSDRETNTLRGTRNCSYAVLRDLPSYQTLKLKNAVVLVIWFVCRPSLLKLVCFVPAATLQWTGGCGCLYSVHVFRVMPLDTILWASPHLTRLETRSMEFDTAASDKGTPP